MLRSYSPENTLVENLEILRENEYPGRLLAVGMTVGGEAVHAYAIGGRSEGSQNRILVNDEGTVRTQVFDEEKEKGDPSLTIYPAMEDRHGLHVVSNGNQTTAAFRYMDAGGTFVDAMNMQTYEPDAPNYTPRITAITDMGSLDKDPQIGISLIRRANRSDTTVRKLYTSLSHGIDNIPYIPGVAHVVHTYAGNGDPLPSFKGAPFRIPAASTTEEMASLVWEHLNPDTRVAVAAKVFDYNDKDIYIINRHQ